MKKSAKRNINLDVKKLKKVTNADNTGKVGWYFDAEKNQYHRLNLEKEEWTGSINANELPDSIADIAARRRKKLVTSIKEVGGTYDVEKLNAATSHISPAMKALIEHKGA